MAKVGVKGLINEERCESMWSCLRVNIPFDRKQTPNKNVLVWLLIKPSPRVTVTSVLN